MPVLPAQFMKWGCLALAMIGAFLIAFLSQIPPGWWASGEPPEITSDQEKAQWLNEHGGDPKALDDRFGTEAGSACSVGADDFLRKIALHDFQWGEDAK